MTSQLVEKFEKANRRPVPYEGLAALSDDPDIIDIEVNAANDDPQHREDFNSALTQPTKGKR